MANKNDIEVEFEKTEEEKVIIPCQTATDWSDYVMSQFTEDELFQGSPTVDGLRRVAELLIGEIIAQRTEILQTPSGYDKRATAVHTIDFLIGMTNDNIQICKSFSGAADSYWGNTDKVYNKYPVAMAESRAEGRALRRALKLKKVVAAEELSEAALQDDPVVEPETEDMITNNQINFIDIMCRNDNRGLNINIKKLVQLKLSDGVSNIRGIKHSESLIIQKILSEYQQDKTKIPPEVIGYEADWKSNFA
jgi:hypothetical protein